MSQSADAVKAVKDAMIALNDALNTAQGLGINCNIVAHGNDKDRNVGRWSSTQVEKLTVENFHQQRSF